MGQEIRAIDWQSDRTERVLRKVYAGDGHPGVLDAIDGRALSPIWSSPGADSAWPAGRTHRSA